MLLVSLITTCRDSDTIVRDLSASASAGVVPALGFLLAQKSCLLSMPSKLNRFTAIIARGLMGLFLSPMGFRSMPVAVQLGRGLGATHGRWSCDRGGKERTRCATSEVYTRKLSKLLKKKQNSQKAFWKFTTSSGKKTDYLLWLHLHTFYNVSLFCLVDPQINKRETVLFANVTKQKKKRITGAIVNSMIPWFQRQN